MEEDSRHEKQPGKTAPLRYKLRAGKGDPACGQLMGSWCQIRQLATTLMLTTTTEAMLEWLPDHCWLSQPPRCG